MAQTNHSETAKDILNDILNHLADIGIYDSIRDQELKKVRYFSNRTPLEIATEIEAEMNKRNLTIVKL